MPWECYMLTTRYMVCSERKSSFNGISHSKNVTTPTSSLVLKT